MDKWISPNQNLLPVSPNIHSPIHLSSSTLSCYDSREAGVYSSWLQVKSKECPNRSPVFCRATYDRQTHSLLQAISPSKPNNLTAQIWDGGRKQDCKEKACKQHTERPGPPFCEVTVLTTIPLCQSNMQISTGGTWKLTPEALWRTWRFWGYVPEHGERWGCQPTGPFLPEDLPLAPWGWKHLQTPLLGNQHGLGSEGGKGHSAVDLNIEACKNIVALNTFQPLHKLVEST